MVFYHGTTDSLKVDRLLLPPIITGILREDWRVKYIDKVFVTNSMRSAIMYSKKASKKYGGNPVVYIVKPIGDCFKSIDTEYITDKALILRRAS